jgi:hypothetical protein
MKTSEGAGRRRAERPRRHGTTKATTVDRANSLRTACGFDLRFGAEAALIAMRSPELDLGFGAEAALVAIRSPELDLKSRR